MEKIFIDKNAHLGDIITILILAQNRAIKNNWIIKIYGPHYIKNLFEIYHFTHLNYIDMRETRSNCSIIELMPYKEFRPVKNNKAHVPFLKINQFEFIAKEGAEPILKIILPKIKLKKTFQENTCLFQFDSRSIHYGKRQLTEQELNSTIKNFKNKDIPIGIGGKDTKIYSSYNYKLGNLNEIAQNLLNCNQFIGIDSGISHLAGSLNVKSNIILTSTIKLHQIELIEFYNIFYPNTICYTLDDIKNFKLIKMF